MTLLRHMLVVHIAEGLDALGLHFSHIGVPIRLDGLFAGQESVVPDFPGIGQGRLQQARILGSVVVKQGRRRHILNDVAHGGDLRVDLRVVFVILGHFTGIVPYHLGHVGAAAILDLQGLVDAVRAVRDLIRIDNLINLSQILNVSTDYILTGKETQDDFYALMARIEALSPANRKMIEMLVDYCISENM